MKHGHLIWTIPGLVFFLYFCIPGLAQSRQVSGIILDKNNIPVIGAAVIIKGTNTGTTTDVDGTFVLELPEQGTLVISCLGYSTKEIKITGTAKYNIVLYEDNNLLDEIVVVGYGTMKKKDLTGAISQIRPDNIAIENPRTIQDVLRGTPGLNVGFDASAKGGGSLQVRGQRSVYTASNHNSPLLVLDGMPFMGELSEINPDDIAQIDILKDASSAAIYGAKAANGVIIITTKQGTKGKPVINISMNFGLSQMTANRDRWNPDEYLQHLQDWRTQSTYGINPETGSMDEVFDLTAISIDIDDPTILDVTPGSEIQFDYDYYCWLLPVELDVKSVGTANVTFTSSGEGSMGMGTVNTAVLTVTATDGEAEFAWSSLEASWNMADYGIPFEAAVEPTFEYERATLTTGYGISSPYATIRIFTDETNTSLYSEQLLATTIDIYGTPYYFEDISEGQDGSLLSFRSEEYPTGNAAISYDSDSGCIVVVWTMAAY